MEKETYEKLIKALEKHEPSSFEVRQKFSPITDEGANVPSSLYLDKDTDISSMNKEQLMFAHTMTHFLYSKGKNKTTMEKLHKKITKKLERHSQFDSLDNGC